MIQCSLPLALAEEQTIDVRKSGDIEAVNFVHDIDINTSILLSRVEKIDQNT